MARRRGLVAIAVACPLVWTLASVAEARPKSVPREEAVPNRMVLASHDAVTTSAPVPPTGGDGPSPAMEAIAVPPPAYAASPTFVDPAGGHARVRPIETTNPYRAR